MIMRIKGFQRKMILTFQCSAIYCCNLESLREGVKGTAVGALWLFETFPWTVRYKAPAARSPVLIRMASSIG